MKIKTVFHGQHMLVCPYCDDDCVHPNQVEVYPVQGVMAATITREGLTVTKSDAAEHVRGISIILTFSCESGHTWTETLAFHKGATRVDTRLLAHADNEEELLTSLQTLWRN